MGIRQLHTGISTPYWYQWGYHLSNYRISGGCQLSCCVSGDINIKKHQNQLNNNSASVFFRQTIQLCNGCNRGYQHPTVVSGGYRLAIALKAKKSTSHWYQRNVKSARVSIAK